MLHWRKGTCFICRLCGKIMLFNMCSSETGTDPAKRRYHKVSQSCSEEGICVAVNYWYVRSELQSSHVMHPLIAYSRPF